MQIHSLEVGDADSQLKGHSKNKKMKARFFSTQAADTTTVMPKPTVTTYSSESTELPIWAGITTFVPSSCAHPVPRDDALSS